MEKNVCYELKMTNNALASFLCRHTHGDVFLNEMTLVQGRILSYLCAHRDEDVFQRDIENLLEIRRSTATSILKRMERNGLITRASVSKDARLKKLSLTERSMEMNEWFEERRLQLEETSRKNISDEELEQFFSILDRIKSNLKEF